LSLSAKSLTYVIRVEVSSVHVCTLWIIWFCPWKLVYWSDSSVKSYSHSSGLVHQKSTIFITPLYAWEFTQSLQRMLDHGKFYEPNSGYSAYRCYIAISMMSPGLHHGDKLKAFSALKSHLHSMSGSSKSVWLLSVECHKQVKSFDTRSLTFLSWLFQHPPNSPAFPFFSVFFWVLLSLDQWTKTAQV
jgi:hypothetical protein